MVVRSRTTGAQRTSVQPAKAQGIRCNGCPLADAQWPDGCPCQEIDITHGAQLIAQGSLAPGVLLVKHGLAGLSVVGSDGSELGCTVRGPQALLGLESLAGLKSPYGVWALTDVVLCRAPSWRMLQGLGSLDSPLGAVLRAQIDEANRTILDRFDAGGPSLQRIARFLLHRCPTTKQGRLEVSQRVLARMLCMTPETMSRALAKLREAGAIASTRPVVIGNSHTLERFAADPSKRRSARGRLKDPVGPSD